jgi:hypothetical protein
VAAERRARVPLEVGRDDVRMDVDDQVLLSAGSR